ncbi:MAG: peptidoglycan-binding domain-containing protein [Solirubrobacterales bacterium]
MALQEVDSKLLPPLKNDPNKSNWWEKVGGLPDLVTRVAKHLVSERGKSESTAIATAISQIRKVCATGTTFGGKVPVKASTKAEYCKAAAEIETKRAAAKARSAVKEGEVTAEDAASIAFSAIGKLSVLAEELGPQTILATIAGGRDRLAEMEGPAAEIAEEIIQLNALIEVFRPSPEVAESLQEEELREAFVIPTLSNLRADVRANRRADNRKSKSSSTKSSTSTSSSGIKRAPKGQTNGGQFISTSGAHPITKGIRKKLGLNPGAAHVKTKSAIEQFQQKHGLEVDGIIGRQTATFLLNGKKVGVGSVNSGLRSRLHKRFA